MKLTVWGSIFGTSGYASHTKGLVNELGKICDVKLATMLQPGWERLVNDLELSMIMKEDSKDRINLIVDLPHNWPIYMDKEKNVGYVVWEGDRVPKSWIEQFRIIDMILVPSEHVRMAIKNTTNDLLIHKKIRIVPHGADRSLFYPEDKKDKTFRFLMNKGFRNPFDRGGVQHGVIAYLQEFKDEDVELFIKFNPAYAVTPEQFGLFLQQLGHNGKPRIAASWEALDINQLRSLYNSCDVFLNPTEAEAFSIPCLEAMACGKPVITTNFGGQTDFVNEKNGWLVGYDLHPVLHELAYEGVSWARPKLEELRVALRKAYDYQVEKDKGEMALKDSKDLTWINSATLISQHLRDLS